MNTSKGFLFFYDWEKAFSNLDGEDFKTLFLAMLNFQRDGTQPPEFNGTVGIIADFVFPQLERRLANSKGGKIGMAKRYENAKKDIENSIVNNGLNKSLNNKLLTQRQDKDLDKTKQDKDSPPKSPKGDDSDFEKRFSEFWNIYPRKDAKSTARKVFEKLKPDETLLNTIVKAVEAQKKCSQWQDSKYIPYASTWLNQRRWEDEPQTQEQNSNKRFNIRPANADLLKEIYK